MWVLVDSSAWVAFFRDEACDPQHPLSPLAAEKRLATNWVIRLELLTGATSEEDYRSLEGQLRDLRDLQLTDEVWTSAARLRWILRRQGALFSVPDIVIASCAMVYDCELLHADRHFDLIAKHAPLKIYKPVRSRAA